jgi:SAM-dependent methyltransferase
VSATTLPMPPLEMRELVGYFETRGYENPNGEPIWPDLPEEAWRHYLDFGCGCGRSARRLLLQTPRPERYVGVDLHRGMIRWCQEHLAPHAPGFEFLHHDVFNAGLNPDRSRPWAAPLPVEDGFATLMEASSVFTHLIEGQAEFYLDEVARVLAPEGVLICTFFLFDKDGYPFMQDSQNALYINDRDPTNAVVYDRAWLLAGLSRRGLVISRAEPPRVRGYHWRLWITPAREGVEAVELPPADAPVGRRPPPQLREGADRIGLDEGATEGAMPELARQPLPPLDPVYAELQNAKAYIASLEQENAKLRAAQAAPSAPAGLLQRLRARLRR